MQRCTDPNTAVFKHYGGRGILVCEQWKDMNVFFAENIQGWSYGLSLDRIKNHLGYEPGNVRWATKKQQANNKRNNVKITFLGETKSMKQWCDHLGVPYGRARRRLKEGKPLEVVFSKENLW